MTIKNFLIIAVVGCFSLALTTAKGQNFQYTNKLEEVSFSDAKSSQLIIISSDDGREFYLAPQWKPTSSLPVAYVSGSYLNVGGKFRFACKPRANEVWVQGKCSNGFKLPPQKLHFDSRDPTLGIYDAASSDAKFADNKVDYYKDFKIDWYVSDNSSGNNSMLIGSSVNDLYITFTASIYSIYYHTLIHLGCTNAVGLTNQDDIVKGIYEEFRDLKVRKVNGTEDLGYWRGANPLNTPACRSTVGFLAYQDAACSEWATFLKDILGMQGIYSNIVVIFWSLPNSDNTYPLTDRSKTMLKEDARNQLSLTDPVYTENLNNIATLQPSQYQVSNAYFFVKNWLVGRDRSFGNCDYYSNNYNACLDDLIGLPGQGNQDPRAFFENHAIVGYKKLDGSYVYYDPSYGTGAFANEEAWENASVDGFGAIIHSKPARSLNISKKTWNQEANILTTTLVTFVIIP